MLKGHVFENWNYGIYIVFTDSADMEVSSCFNGIFNLIDFSLNVDIVKHIIILNLHCYILHYVLFMQGFHILHLSWHFFLPMATLKKSLQFPIDHIWTTFYPLNWYHNRSIWQESIYVTITGRDTTHNGNQHIQNSGWWCIWWNTLYLIETLNCI